MTANDLANTSWAREFLKECPSQFENAVRLASDPDLEVMIERTDDSGSLVYAISPISAPKFWFDAFSSKRKAIQFCHSMSWKIHEKQ